MFSFCLLFLFEERDFKFKRNIVASVFFLLTFSFAKEKVREKVREKISKRYCNLKKFVI